MISRDRKSTRSCSSGLRPLFSDGSLGLGWLVCGAGLYAHMAFLELYWNFINWTPMYDIPSLFASGGMIGGLIGLFFLARVPSVPWVRVMSFLICVALLAVGIRLAFPEPVQTEGLLARVAPSPTWFRLLRLVLLTLPLVTWCVPKKERVAAASRR